MSGQGPSLVIFECDRNGIIKAIRESYDPEKFNKYVGLNFLDFFPFTRLEEGKKKFNEAIMYFKLVEMQSESLFRNVGSCKIEYSPVIDYGSVETIVVTVRCS